MPDDIQQVFLASKSALLRFLQDCISKKEFSLGRQLHSVIINCGFESENLYGRQLVRLYIALGNVQEASLSFDQVLEPNISTWSAIIAAYAKLGECRKALELYDKMEHSGVKPNNEVFLCLLKVCTSQGLVTITQALELLQKQGIHLSKNIVNSLLQGCLKVRDLAACRQLFEVMKSNGLVSFALYGNQLIRNFTSCGSLLDAKQVFEMVEEPSVHSWNAIISSHVNLGDSECAISLFQRMQKDGIEPNQYIFTCTLKACGSIQSFDLGMLVHHHILVSNMETDVTVGNALVDLYSKCGELEGACKVFDELNHRDVISWGTMVVGFSQHGHDLAVVELYQLLEKEGVNPNRVIFLHVMKACGNIGAVGHGRLVHGQVLKTGLLLSDPLVGSSLVGMYANCGNFEDLHTVFKRLPTRDVIAWGAMIGGYVQHGDYPMAAQYLEDMQREGVEPDEAVYTNILIACSHAGHLGEGLQHFHVMTKKCGLMPSTIHYNCLIDLLARTGCLVEAKALLHTVPVATDISGWKSLLTSCGAHSNKMLGRSCFDAAVHSDPHDSAGYVLMSNIYADSDKWEDVDSLLILRKSANAVKVPGKAWIEINSTVNEFVVGQDHCEDSSFAVKFNSLSRHMRQQGYIVQLDLVMDSHVELA